MPEKHRPWAFVGERSERFVTVDTEGTSFIRTFTHREGPHLVTYHKVRVANEQPEASKTRYDLRTAVLVTWE